MKSCRAIKNFAGLYEKYYREQYSKGKGRAGGPC